jgi:hypothetical protein
MAYSGTLSPQYSVRLMGLLLSSCKRRIVEGAFRSRNTASPALIDVERFSGSNETLITVPRRPDVESFAGGEMRLHVKRG